VYLGTTVPPISVLRHHSTSNKCIYLYNNISTNQWQPASQPSQPSQPAQPASQPEWSVAYWPSHLDPPKPQIVSSTSLKTSSKMNVKWPEQCDMHRFYASRKTSNRFKHAAQKVIKNEPNCIAFASRKTSNRFKYVAQKVIKNNENTWFSHQEKPAIVSSTLLKN